MLLITLLQIVDLLLTVLMWIIIIQAILSWLVAFNVVNTHNDVVRQLLFALNRITEPIYRPIRRIMPDFGALDFSPLVVLLLIQILRSIVIPALMMQSAVAA
jgi:YggT family protein